jgi:hypothetical protein
MFIARKMENISMKIFAVTNGVFEIETIKISLNKNKDFVVQAIYNPVG